MFRRSRTAAAFLLALCGIAAAQEHTGRWIDVPFVAQQKDGCGAATIAMVMQYWQQHGATASTRAAEYKQIDSSLHADAAHGIFASDMVRYFEQNGYRAFALAGTTADLEQHLAKGRPIIVALKPGAGLPLHYAVVAGLDSASHTVLLNDPAQRKLLKEDSDRFEHEWSAAGHWMLLALPKAAQHE